MKIDEIKIVLTPKSIISNCPSVTCWLEWLPYMDTYRVFNLKCNKKNLCPIQTDHANNFRTLFYCYTISDVFSIKISMIHDQIFYGKSRIDMKTPFVKRREFGQVTRILTPYLLSLFFCHFQTKRARKTSLVSNDR